MFLCHFIHLDWSDHGEVFCKRRKNNRNSSATKAQRDKKDLLIYIKAIYSAYRPA
jgi:hypothetical protein